MHASYGARWTGRPGSISLHACSFGMFRHMICTLFANLHEHGKPCNSSIRDSEIASCKAPRPKGRFQGSPSTWKVGSIEGVGVTRHADLVKRRQKLVSGSDGRQEITCCSRRMHADASSERPPTRILNLRCRQRDSRVTLSTPTLTVTRGADVSGRFRFQRRRPDLGGHSLH